MGGGRKGNFQNTLRSTVSTDQIGLPKFTGEAIEKVPQYDIHRMQVKEKIPPERDSKDGFAAYCSLNRAFCKDRVTVEELEKAIKTFAPKVDTNLLLSLFVKIIQNCNYFESKFAF